MMKVPLFLYQVYSCGDVERTDSYGLALCFLKLPVMLNINMDVDSL